MRLALIIGLPLRSLTRAIERRTAGEKSSRARVHRRDEIGLAATLAFVAWHLLRRRALARAVPAAGSD